MAKLLGEDFLNKIQGNWITSDNTKLKVEKKECTFTEENTLTFSIEVNMDNLKINGWTLNIDGWNLKCHFEELMWVQDDTGKFIIWHRENENEEMKAELITLEMLEGTWWTSSYHKMAVVGTKCICDGKSFHPIVEYSDRFVCNGLTLNKAEKAF
jgi:hypothetical protein